METYAGSGEWQGVVSGGTYMGGAVTYSSTTFTDSSTTNRTTTSFRWRQSALRTTETYTGQSPGSSTYSYDDAGTLASVRILETNNTLRNRNVWLRSDAQGFYLERDERDGSITGGDPREVHYYVDGVGVGDISNNGTSDVDYVTGMSLRTASGTGAFRNGATTGVSYADFDQSYDPINGLNYEATATRYTVQDGDTIEGIALRLWGDASYWYLIAEANGLTGTETLAAGRTLTIPNKIHNAHNNSDVYRVYDPNEIIGSTSPNAPKAPKKNKCGAFGQILIVAIAVAVTVVTSGAAAAAAANVTGGISAGLGALAGGSLGLTGVAIGAGAAALGSVVSQSFGVATGIQSNFNWKGVALSALAGGVSAGIGATGLLKSASPFLQGAARGIVSNVLSQGVGVATGLQSKFNWAGIATAGIGGGVGNGLGWQGTWGHAASGMAAGLAAAAGESLITGNSFGDTLISSLPSIIGNTIGNMAADAVAGNGRGGAGASGGGKQNNPDVASNPGGGSNSAADAAVADIVVTARRSGYNPVSAAIAQVAANTTGAAKSGPGNPSPTPAPIGDPYPMGPVDMSTLTLDQLQQNYNDTVWADAAHFDKTGEHYSDIGDILGRYGPLFEAAAARVDLANAETAKFAFAAWGGPMLLAGGAAAAPVVLSAGQNFLYANALRLSTAGMFGTDMIAGVQVGTYLPAGAGVLTASLATAERIGVTFKGGLYRAVPEGGNPLEMSFSVAANNRYTAPGQAGLYFASNARTVEAEFVNNGSSLAGRTLHSFPEASVDNLLDLTNSATRRGLGVSLSDLTRTGGTSAWRYEVTQPLGAFAQRNGYSGIIAPSAQADGGINLILFSSKGVR